MENYPKKQRSYTLDHNIQFSSHFQSGNLSSVIQKQNLLFELAIQADPYSTYRTWFYFSVQGIPQRATATFCITNMGNQVKLFKEGHLPVFRTQQDPTWNRIRIPIQQNGFVRGENGFELTFKHTFVSKSTHYFAFSYPWTCSQNHRLIDSLLKAHHERYFCDYRALCQSTKGEDVKLFSVSRQSDKSDLQVKQFSHLNNMKITTIPSKKGIFVSARVHPGEVASSHILNGFLQFLFSHQPQAQTLLQKCIFYIVPIVNPDGVTDGNFRCDSLGKNLNRFYSAPSEQEQPEIFGVKSFVVEMIKSKLIHFCLDLHAHVNKQGCFVYGNSTSSLKEQVDVLLFPKLLQFNSRFFDYESCNFSEKNMSSKDKGDELSKEGASRVTFYKETGLVNCWTLECNYNSSRMVNDLPKEMQEQGISKSVSHTILLNSNEPPKREELTFLNIKQFHEIGRDIGITLLDFYRLRNSSRYINTPLKNMANLKLNLSIQALRMIPFRFDLQCRKLQNNINSRLCINQTLAKILQKLNLQPFNTFSTIKSLRQQQKSKSRSKDEKNQSLRSIQIKSISSKDRNIERVKTQKVSLPINIPKVPRQK